MNESGHTVTRWGQSDFDSMSWHDCLIHSVRLDQEGEYQSDLVFDLDFIVEWITTETGWLNFRVAPALLRFRGVSDLHIDTRLDFKQALEIDSIDRSQSTRSGFNDFHWTIRLHGYPQREPNLIAFNAVDFVQALTAPPVLTATGQSLSWTERVKMIKEYSGQSGRGAG